MAGERTERDLDDITMKEVERERECEGEWLCVRQRERVRFFTVTMTG